MKVKLKQIYITLSGLVILAALSLFAIYVWPTRYSYDHLRRGPLDLPVRIDRFTGETEVLMFGRGWQPMVASRNPSPSPTPNKDPLEDLFDPQK